MAKHMFILLVVLAACAIGHAKHVHPRNIVQIEDPASDIHPIYTDIDGLPIEVITDLKPSLYVPPNNVLFFKTYPPCEEGFERDVQGDCREVWY